MTSFDININIIQYQLKSYAHRPRVSRGGRAGNARGFPERPTSGRTNEARDEIEMKPRESRVLLKLGIKKLQHTVLK